MSSLPYHDTKPQGAPDFYFAIQATFRFILQRFGREGWIRYLGELGRGYFTPVNRLWKQEGLPGVARTWKDFFDAEPRAEVGIEEEADKVTIRVQRCPAIAHLKASGRELLPCFCQHCYYLNQARAETAGLSMSVEGGNGHCVHRYARAGIMEQDLDKIEEVR